MEVYIAAEVFFPQDGFIFDTHTPLQTEFIKKFTMRARNMLCNGCLRSKTGNFSHMVSDDLHDIIKDIREAHKKDSDTAPETTIANELKKDLEDATKFKGSIQEKQAVLYCKRLGINYNKLSTEEFQTLIKILNNSSLLKSPLNKKKKRK